jgi:hypothetical protein
MPNENRSPAYTKAAARQAEVRELRSHIQS